MGDCQTRQSEIPPSELKSAATSNTVNSCSPSPPSSLSIFHEDILLAILGFVADTPFEMVNVGKWIWCIIIIFVADALHISNRICCALSMQESNLHVVNPR